MSKGKSSFNDLIWIVLFKALIDFAYKNTISIHFQVFSFKFDIIRFLISWILLIATFKIINSINSKADSKTSSLLLYIIYLLSYIPGLSLWALGNLSNHYFIYFNIYWIIIFILMYRYSFFQVPIIKIDLDRKVSDKVIIAVFVLFTAYGIYFSYKYSGLRIHFNLLTVYDLRSSSANASTFEGLLYYIISTIVFPLYAIIYYANKKWMGFIVAVIMELLMFSVAGHKLYFFIIPVGIIAYHFYDINLKKYIPRLLSVMVIIGIFEKLVLKSYIVISFFVRRLLFIPAILDSYYFEFFLNNEPTYFGQDKLLKRIGLESPYTKPVSHVIGDLYGNGGNANTGLFGDAISNLGLPSVIIYPVIFLLLMILIDIITRGIKQKYYMAILVSIVMVLLNNEISGILYNFIIPMSFLFVFLQNTSFFQEHREL